MHSYNQYHYYIWSVICIATSQSSKGKPMTEGKRDWTLFIVQFVSFSLLLFFVRSIYQSIKFKQALQRPLESLHAHCKAEQPARGQHEGLARLSFTKSVRSFFDNARKKYRNHCSDLFCSAGACARDDGLTLRTLDHRQIMSKTAPRSPPMDRWGSCQVVWQFFWRSVSHARHLLWQMNCAATAGHVAPRCSVPVFAMPHFASGAPDSLPRAHHALLSK